MTRFIPMCLILLGCDYGVAGPQDPGPDPDEGLPPMTVSADGGPRTLVADPLGFCAPDPRLCATDSIYLHHAVSVYGDTVRWQLEWAQPALELPDSLGWRYRLQFAGPGKHRWTGWTLLIPGGGGWGAGLMIGDTATHDRPGIECDWREAMDVARRVRIIPEVVHRERDSRYSHRSDRGAWNDYRFPAFSRRDNANCDRGTTPHTPLPPPGTPVVPPGTPDGTGTGTTGGTVIPPGIPPVIPPVTPPVIVPPVIPAGICGEPGTPTGLTLEDVGETDVRLTWAHAPSPPAGVERSYSWTIIRGGTKKLDSEGAWVPDVPRQTERGTTTGTSSGEVDFGANRDVAPVTGYVTTEHTVGTTCHTFSGRAET